MTVIIFLVIFGFLYIPLLIVVLAIKEHNAKVNAKLRRRQNIEDMTEALTLAADVTKRQA
jgi:hypothetical protein